MSTAAEQEADRRYPVSSSGVFWVDVRNRWQAIERRVDFVAGWEECESRHRELLEAAREYRDAHHDPQQQILRLLAAAAALGE